jgi:hypothetical protein
LEEERRLLREERFAFEDVKVFYVSFLISEEQTSETV